MQISQARIDEWVRRIDAAAAKLVKPATGTGLQVPFTVPSSPERPS